MNEPLKVGFLGAGKMASALAAGWIKAGLVAHNSVWASDPIEPVRAAFQKKIGGQVSDDNRAVAQAADVLVLAVKPQNVDEVLQGIAPFLGERHLAISIAAGVRLARLIEASKPSDGRPGPRWVRVMPNTPCLIGQGAAGFCTAPGGKAEDAALTAKLFGCVGVAFEVKEGLLDAVTGLSGSGPAYVYQMIEALSDGGVLMGLPRDAATRLAAQTLKGAADMVLQTGLHPGELKDQVTSPGGTTIAGLAALERGGLRAALIDAVQAATRRATELG